MKSSTQIVRSFLTNPDEQREMPIEEHYTQEQLARNMGCTGRSIRQTEANAFAKIQSGLRRNPELLEVALDQPGFIARSMAALMTIQRLPDWLQVEITGKTWGKSGRKTRKHSPSRRKLPQATQLDLSLA